MRKDMGKIVTEKPRHGSGLPNLKTRMSVKWKGDDAEYDIPSKASNSASRQYGYNKRTFTDVLGPLKRYVFKQIGRKWNDVYSEMCKYLDKRKVTHAHVFDHIYSWIALNVYKGRNGFYYEQPYSWMVRDLYVDPQTGIIRKQIQPKTEPKKPVDWLIVVGDLEEFKKIDGVWYHTKYENYQWAEEKYCPVRMKYLRRRMTNKRQLGKKDLKKMGLRE